MQNKEKAMHGMAAKADHVQIMGKNGKSVINTDALRL